MDDHQIIALYWARNEQAIAASQEKYGALCLGSGSAEEEVLAQELGAHISSFLRGPAPRTAAGGCG